MASDYASFWQSLLAATSGLSIPLAGTNSLLRAVYRDVKSQTGDIGQTINVPVPADMFSGVVDAPYSDPTFDEYAVGTVPIVFNKKPHKGTIIRSFEQYNSPVDIKTVLLQPSLIAVVKKANAYVAALITSGNFGVNTAVATTGSKVTTTQFLAGQQALLEKGVDVTDPTQMTFVQAPAVWSRQLDDAAWTDESSVGINQAEDARRDGALRVAFGTAMAVDQLMPVTGTTPNRTYTSILMSRYAIAAAFRPLPPGGPSSFTTYVMVEGIPVRVMLSHEHTKDAWLLSTDIGMGCAVVRPEMGVRYTTAES
jgi:hypothetical protein